MHLSIYRVSSPPLYAGKSGIRRFGATGCRAEFATGTTTYGSQPGRKSAKPHTGSPGWKLSFGSGGFQWYSSTTWTKNPDYLAICNLNWNQPFSGCKKRRFGQVDNPQKAFNQFYSVPEIRFAKNQGEFGQPEQLHQNPRQILRIQRHVVHVTVELEQEGNQLAKVVQVPTGAAGQFFQSFQQKGPKEPGFLVAQQQIQRFYGVVKGFGLFVVGGSRGSWCCRAGNWRRFGDLLVDQVEPGEERQHQFIQYALAQFQSGFSSKYSSMANLW